MNHADDAECPSLTRPCHVVRRLCASLGPKALKAASSSRAKIDPSQYLKVARGEGSADDRRLGADADAVNLN